MRAFIVRRLLYTIPILFGVMLITFLLFFTVVTPADIARQTLGEKASNPNQIAEWLRKNGYAELNGKGKEKARQLELGTAPQGTMITAEDIVPYGQFRLFVNYIGDLVTWDFGETRDKRQISDVLLGGMGPSLMLTIPIFILSEILGVFFALFAALYRGTRIDRSLIIGAVILMSVSPVAFIMFAQKFFAADWGYFPISGYAEGIASIPYLALPVLIYVVTGLGSLIRFNRIIVLDEINQDYVRTARAKGLGQNTVLFKHVLRNIMIPLITHWAAVIPFLFLGSLLLESFFGIPGLGGITVQAIEHMDIHLMRALVFLGTLLYIVSTLVGDILYAVVDPRVKLK